MKTNKSNHTAVPYPRIRLLMADGGRMGLMKHTVHGLVEFDITKAREAIRQHKAQTGEALSFSAFFLACLGNAIDVDKQMHAYRNLRNQLIIFDEVDVNMLFEVEVDGKKTSYYQGGKQEERSRNSSGDPGVPESTSRQSGIGFHRPVCAPARICQAPVPVGAF
jgi:hypothetical protein